MTSTELVGEDICFVPLGTCPFQPGPRNEVFALLRTSGARADVREVDVKRISELHAVVAAGEVSARGGRAALWRDRASRR